MAGRSSTAAWLAAAFVTTAAHAEQPPDPVTPPGGLDPVPVTVAEVPGPAGSTDPLFQIGNVGRPIFLGLVAMSFLVLSGIAAERAEKRRKPPSSRRPGR